MVLESRAAETGVVVLLFLLRIPGKYTIRIKRDQEWLVSKYMF